MRRFIAREDPWFIDSNVRSCSAGLPPLDVRRGGECVLLITRRLRLRQLLATREEGFRLDEIIQILAVTRETVISDLKHLQLSLRHRDERLFMVPPACATCGFTFRAEEPKAPTKCPQCKSKDIEMPVFKVDVEAEA